MRYRLIVSQEQCRNRLDLFLLLNNISPSRSQIKNLIEGGYVLVNGCKSKPSYKVKEDDIIEVYKEDRKIEVEPENIELDIIYEDSSIIVVNKPAHMPVHIGAGNYRGTLVNALLYRCKDLSGIGGVIRPGIVHRLDKNTSGVMVIAKNDHAHLYLSNQFKEHRVKKIYIALVYGRIEQSSCRITIPIGRDSINRTKISIRTKRAKEAITNFKLMKYLNNFSLLEITPETGRTHQIRVHLSLINHPIVGDDLYGGRRRAKNISEPVLKKYIMDLNRHFLHSHILGFIHPYSKKYIEFSSPLPQELERVIECIESISNREV
jgi:23S rRNA pseudouridine1911/1915/1917 synthase